MHDAFHPELYVAEKTGIFDCQDSKHPQTKKKKAKARLLSQTCPGAGAVFNALPSESDLRLGAGPFSWFISHHLGSEELRDFEIAVAKKCPDCRLVKPDSPEEDLAQHVFQCPRGGGTHLRHDAITRSLALCLRQVDLQVRVEPRAQFEGTGNGGPDLRLYQFPWGDGSFKKEDIFVDVSVVNPSAKEACKYAATIPLHAARGREKMKMKKYEQLSAEGPSGSDLTDRGRVVGAVMEVPGALGKDMAAILRKAAAYADHLDMRPPAESTTWTSMLWEHYWRQRLAVCLVNYSYRMRSMIHSKAVGLATPALGASSRCRR